MMETVLTRGALLAAALLAGTGLALLLMGRALLWKIAGLISMDAGAILLLLGAGGGLAGSGALALAGLLLPAAGVALALSLMRHLQERYGTCEIDQLLALARKEEDE